MTEDVAAKTRAPPCFAGDSTVQLDSGEIKTIAVLEVGDKVLSAYYLGSIAHFSFSEIAFLPHAPNLDRSLFVRLTTVVGSSIAVTPTHLLMGCDGSLQAADTVRCLRTVSGNETVASTEAFESDTLGVYSAVTLGNEYLVVDGVIASPFAIAHDIVNHYYDLHRHAFRVLVDMERILQSFGALRRIVQTKVFNAKLKDLSLETMSPMRNQDVFVEDLNAEYATRGAGNASLTLRKRNSGWLPAAVLSSPFLIRANGAIGLLSLLLMDSVLPTTAGDKQRW